LLGLCAAAARGAQAPPPRKRALFVYGGWEGHEPAKCRDLWVPWLEGQGFEVQVSANHDPYADAALMGRLDLVVQTWTMGTIAKEPLRGLVEAVRGGLGFAGWHGGIVDAYRQETDYQFMVGGQFVAHPGGMIDFTVHVADPQDPIMAGIADFKVRTEQYYMHVDPNNRVLATTAFTGEHASWIAGATMPVVWKRLHGKGRVFFSALGHQASDFSVREVGEITRRGLLWAGEGRTAPTPDLVSPVYRTR
jgi:uncharacterized protein